MNSGNSASSVARYVRQHRIPCPVIIDSNRAFERAVGVNEVSLQNIWQARVLTAEGEIKPASGRDLDQAAQTALDGARWNVDPGSITPDLIPAWMRVEFGSFAPAASLIHRSLNSRQPDTKAAATVLNNYVSEKMTADVKSAADAEARGELWQAYKTLKAVMLQYKGFEIPRNVAPDITRLEAEQAVKDEVSAQKKMALARRSAASGSATALKRAEKMLNQLIEEFPDTETAAEARALLSGQN